LREKHRLRVFENRVLRKILGPKRDEDGSLRKFHNDELHGLYSSPDIVRVIKSRRMGWARHIARMREGRCVYTVLVGRSEVKRPLGRPRRRREDNIKMDLRDRWDELDSVDSGGVQWRVFCEHGNEPSGSIKKEDYSLTSSVTIRFSKNYLAPCI
jgi:hypothetical protein